MGEETVFKQACRADAAIFGGRRAKHNGDQLAAVARRAGDNVKTGIANETGLDAVGAVECAQ